MYRPMIMAILLVATLEGYTQTPTRWRGPQGNGTYPETGLLRQWPSEGPGIAWSYEELGQGHSSAVVAEGFVYTSGMINETGYLFKFDLEGNLVYRKPYGPEFSQSWYGTRGSPVIAGEKGYLESGHGKLVCFSTATGEILWSKELFGEFDGSNITWGVNETPVVDGDIIYATPGGRRNNVVALNRHDGSLVWTSSGAGEKAAYCTPLLFGHNGRKILATHTSSHLIGLDAATGELLWSRRQPNQWSVHANTPIYHNGSLFYFSGYGQGGGLLELSDDGTSVSRKWFNEKLDSRMGGAVLVDGHLYLSGDNHRDWKCADWETGEISWESREVGRGVVIYADGLLILYSDRGELALAEADPGQFRVLSETRVRLGSEQHWAHPVIGGGMLFVRHGNALIAYKIK